VVLGGGVAFYERDTPVNEGGGDCSSLRVRRYQLKRFNGVLSENQGHNLALRILYGPYSGLYCLTCAISWP